jgi:hypothetical protein
MFSYVIRYTFQHSRTFIIWAYQLLLSHCFAINFMLAKLLNFKLKLRIKITVLTSWQYTDGRNKFYISLQTSEENWTNITPIGLSLTVHLWIWNFLIIRDRTGDRIEA